MKKTTLLTAVMVAGTLVCSAAAEENSSKCQGKGRTERGEQKKVTPEERMKRMSKKFSEKLKLTEEQQTKLNALLQAQADKMKAQHEARKAKHEAAKAEGKEKPTEAEQEAKREEMRKQMKATRDKLHSDISAILEPEQQEKLNEILNRMKERKQEMGQKRGEAGGRGPKGRGERKPAEAKDNE